MTLLNIRIDENLKKEAEEVLDEIGLNMTSAICIYLKTIVRNRAIPFELSLNKKEEEKESNELTLEDPDVASTIEWVMKQDYVSLARMQRECFVGFARAGRTVTKLINLGIIDNKYEDKKGFKVIK